MNSLSQKLQAISFSLRSSIVVVPDLILKITHKHQESRLVSICFQGGVLIFAILSFFLSLLVLITDLFGGRVVGI